ncbi:MAG TPA: hypothetical protein VGZ52_09055 [Acidimicrobiales bacterium]|jgi:beta-mannosidase|nr:hypothetical protein [Acidimicrobiales bacterium]
MPPLPDAITGWEVSSDQALWMPAGVPGTVAGALGETASDYDAQDWWFRARVDADAPADDEEVLLHLGGIATLADVWLDGELVVQSTSMFESHVVTLERRAYVGVELLIGCRALAPVLAERRSPRARWRPRIAPAGLRHVRTMILGRAPGFAAGPAVVGPWRPVTLERRRLVALDGLRVRTRMAGNSGLLDVAVTPRPLGSIEIREVTVVLSSPNGTVAEPLGATPIVVPDAARWWPHTHGEPVRHGVQLVIETNHGSVELDAGTVGFRTLENDGDVERDGIHLLINGEPVFARGAVWTPVDFTTMAPDDASLRIALEQVRSAGMNMVRVPGTSAYESPAFYDLCDELGVLVWQDFMFANFDYSIEDAAFRSQVAAEARTVLDQLGSRPSLAVLCGNSEVEQQAAMFGRPVTEARGELFGVLLPRLVREAEVDAPYVPSAPCGGDLPFRPGVGVANYFGVGGYRRGFDDVRRANVRFAAECLALSNLPNDDGLCDTGIPADVGADWNFADVRNHYAVELYGADATSRLESGRATSGEVMAEVFGEWRRAESPCGGGLVLWLRDVQPGAGWGLVDHRGEPKVAYHHVRRILAPVAVWMVDEGQGGIDVHVANDRPAPLIARLRVACYRGRQTKVEEAARGIEVPPNHVSRWGVEELVGHFIDASYAFRFGPPGFDLIVASVERGDELVAQAFRHPVGRPVERETAEALGLVCELREGGNGSVLRMETARLVQGVRVHTPGLEADDNAFSIEPGGSRSVALRLTPGGGRASGPAFVTAVNLVDAIPLHLTTPA